MPELPEVETTRRGIEPHILSRKITKIVIRQPKLRWPIPANLPELLTGQKIDAVERRAKYLLLRMANGCLIIHLGMSGSLRICDHGSPVEKHDHFDLRLDNNKTLRLRDPRKFGAVLWSENNSTEHPLMAGLGPEPFDEHFNGDYLKSTSTGKKIAIKQFIMDGKVVTGVGNIYACEALYRAAINPKRAAGKISGQRFERLSIEIKRTLREAIEQGGTTLKDFVNESGKPGYFQQQLSVYGREGLPCPNCESPIKKITLGQRSTFYCPKCQT